MEIEFWWLLALPLFFALGWLAARIDIRQVVRESRALPQSYLTGLNLLLEDKPDKAVDAFIEAVRLDPYTVELQFALGSLFRRRGETSRAIRLHQSLVQREEITHEQRLQALAALGQDYLRAGLLDRAEEAFIKLRGTVHDRTAIGHLLEIYQQEKDWGKAIDVANALPDHESLHWRTEVSNFYCELATEALADSRAEDARSHIDKAYAINPRCVRASMLLGELFVITCDDEAAIEAWKRVEQQDPVYLALIAEPIAAAYSRLGKVDQGQTLLRSWLSRHPAIDLLEQVYRWELDARGAQSAYDLVREELRRNPTLLGLEKLLEAAALTASAEQRGDVDLVRQLIHNHTRRVARYACRSCGFKARKFQWRCPACGGWETYPPKRSEEFDLEP